MLLGQAESGKSTLQKQFQLYYASQTLERERPLWRPIVYSNILKALRMLIDELDREQGSITPTPGSTPVSSSVLLASPELSSSSVGLDTAWPPDLIDLSSPLLSLIASEDALASEVSGGITVGGGRSGVYVRAGWQALITPNRAWPLTDIRDAANRPTVITNMVAQSLSATQDIIAQFWSHPTVVKLVSSNRVRLEESAALCVSCETQI
jgi:guanine nucleotide-binding protein alpha-1 subunit